jgi:hypothetical protein
MTERRGRVVNTPASYFGGHGFKFQPEDMLAWLRFFMDLLGPSSILKLCYHRSFQILSNSFAYRRLIQRYIVFVTEEASLNGIQTTESIYEINVRMCK